jgi:hypothetical protein
VLQEVNPSLKDAESVKQTVAVGCSLARSALGMSLILHSVLAVKLFHRRDSALSVAVDWTFSVNSCPECTTYFVLLPTLRVL